MFRTVRDLFTRFFRRPQKPLQLELPVPFAPAPTSETPQAPKKSRVRRTRGHTLSAPHSNPFIMVRTRELPRQYHRCTTAEEAHEWLKGRHGVIAHINGWGQVTKWERL